MHTVSLTAEAPDPLGGAPGPPPRAPVALGTASFRPSFDERVGAAVPLIVFDAPAGGEHDYDARVLGALAAARPGDACAALHAMGGGDGGALPAAAAPVRVSAAAGTTAIFAREVAAATEAGRGGDGSGGDGVASLEPSMTACEFWEARLALARAALAAGYDGVRSPPLEWYLVMNATVGARDIATLLAAAAAEGEGGGGGGGGGVGRAPPPGAVLQLDARDYEPHAAAAARICARALRTWAADGAATSGSGVAGCAAILEPAIQEVRASGRAFFARAKRPDARAVCDALYPRVNEIRCGVRGAIVFAAASAAAVSGAWMAAAGYGFRCACAAAAMRNTCC